MGVIVIIAIWVVVQVSDVLKCRIGGLVVSVAALGFGVQPLVQDLLVGFLIIVEKQYGFGDLVALTVNGAADEARGTVKDVTLP